MTTISRKQFGGVAAAMLLASASDGSAQTASVQESSDKFASMNNGHKPVIAMLMYPGMTLMDMLGPQTVLSTSCDVHLVWKNTAMLVTDTDIHIKPDTTFTDCPKDLDALFVGGGPGQIAIMNDPEVLRFMADRGSRAKYVTSVCSGSLVLGAAGLLQGYKATSHWAAHEELSLFGAIPVAARVVVDRNRVSGGGVTAGLDFGLVLLATMLGDDMAKTTQLAMEYDPHPPFNAGSPQTAGQEITKKVIAWLGPMTGKMRAACEEAGKNMAKYHVAVH